MEIGIGPALTRTDLGAIVHLRLSRPENRNALSLKLLKILIATFAEIATNTEIAAVVISGDGSVFCAGHDLKELTQARNANDNGAAFFEAVFKTCAKMMQAITALPQPVIAAVEGLATAAGCQLVATCDLAIAGKAASFCTPGVNLGLFCTTPMVAISANVAPKHALEMLLLGDVYDADTAHRFGLVNRIVDAQMAVPRALEMASQIAGKSRATVRLGKKAFYQTRRLSPRAAYDRASHIMACNMLGVEAREGIASFLAKRVPVWTHEDGG